MAGAAAAHRNQLQGMPQVAEQLQQAAAGHDFIAGMRCDHHGTRAGGNQGFGVDDRDGVQLRGAVPDLCGLAAFIDGNRFHRGYVLVWLQCAALQTLDCRALSIAHVRPFVASMSYGMGKSPISASPPGPPLNGVRGSTAPTGNRPPDAGPGAANANARGAGHGRVGH
ncbi:hypothetical protein D3C86_1270320 [compost metagenome]